LCSVALAAVALWFLPAGLAEAAHHPIEALIWVAFIAAANLLTVPMLPKLDVEVGLGTPVSIAAAVVLPAPFALLVNLFGFTNEHEFRRTTSYWLIAFNRAQIGLSAGVASVAAAAQPFGPLVGTGVAAFVFTIVNTAAVALSLWTRGRLRLTTAAKGAANPFPRFALDFALVGLLALVIVIAYDELKAFAVFLLLLPMWLGYNALNSARESEDRAEELAVRVRELEALHALGSQMLGARRSDQLVPLALGALRMVLASDEVELSLSGELPPGGQLVKVPGAEPGAIRVSSGLGERSLSVVEAIAGLLGMAVQRVELEQELADAERARTALSGKILEEGTRERSRIALEIHDDVLPYLAAAEIQADNVASAIAVRDDGRARRLSAATSDAIHDGIASLRQVLEALRRQIVVPGSLRCGLEEALEELRLKHGLETQLTMPEALPKLPLAVEILILETLRGCLANVARHAQAGRVQIRIDVKGALITVEMLDDGCGFDPSGVSGGHHGLALMAQRVELARGVFEVTSTPGQGTRVRLEVPM
jgi:signal transduction histidine kinase